MSCSSDGAPEVAGNEEDRGTFLVSCSSDGAPKVAGNEEDRGTFLVSCSSDGAPKVAGNERAAQKKSECAALETVRAFMEHVVKNHGRIGGIASGAMS